MLQVHRLFDPCACRHNTIAALQQVASRRRRDACAYVLTDMRHNFFSYDKCLPTKACRRQTEPGINQNWLSDTVVHQTTHVHQYPQTGAGMLGKHLWSRPPTRRPRISPSSSGKLGSGSEDHGWSIPGTGAFRSETDFASRVCDALGDVRSSRASRAISRVKALARDRAEACVGERRMPPA